MKYYLISVMEYRFGIIPIAEGGIPREADFDFEPIFLFPRLDSDFEICLKEENLNDEFYRDLALFALKKYFFNLRALPLEEIEICHSVSNFKLKNDNKILLKLSKSKRKFTKRVREILGCEIEAFYESGVLIYESRNIESFDEKALDYAMLKEDNPCHSSLCFSRVGSLVSIKRRGKIKSLESAIFVAEILSERGEFKRDEEFLFEFQEGRIKLLNLGNDKLEAEIIAELIG